MIFANQQAKERWERLTNKDDKDKEKDVLFVESFIDLLGKYLEDEGWLRSEYILSPEFELEDQIEFAIGNITIKLVFGDIFMDVSEILEICFSEVGRSMRVYNGEELLALQNEAVDLIEEIWVEGASIKVWWTLHVQQSIRNQALSTSLLNQEIEGQMMV